MISQAVGRCWESVLEPHKDEDSKQKDSATERFVVCSIGWRAVDINGPEASQKTINQCGEET